MQWFYFFLMAISAIIGLFILTIQCRSRFWLACIQAFITAYLGLIWLDAQNFHISPKLYFCLLAIVYLPGPLVLGYISHITTRKYVYGKDFICCLLPLMAIVCAPQAFGERHWWQLVSASDYDNPQYQSLFQLISLMSGVQTLAYIVTAFQRLLRLRKDWSSYQSKTLPDSWFRMMLTVWMILVATALQVVSAYLHPAGETLSIGDIGFLLLLLYFGWLAIATGWKNAKGREDELFLTSEDLLAVAAETAEPMIETPIEQPASQQAEHAQQVRQRVLKEALFLQDDLSLASLATQLELTSHKLSELINQQLQTTFYEFVNDCRVHYAAEKMLQQPALTISEVYIDAGFTSKSTFYGYFKKTFNCTPTQYRRQLQQGSPD